MPIEDPKEIVDGVSGKMLKGGWLQASVRVKYGLIFCMLGLVLCSMRAVGWYSEVPGDLIDSRFNNALLEHLYLWVRGEADQLWSPDFFYPFKGALAFSDNHFGSGAFYVLFRFVGLDRIAAYQSWFVLGMTLNFAAAYYAFRRLCFSDLAAAAGAFAFAFALSNLSHEAHSQLTFRLAVPLAFLFLWQGLERGSPLKIAIAAAFTGYQFLCSIYLGIFLIYLLGFVALFAILFRWSTFSRLIEEVKNQDAKTTAWTLALLALSAVSTGLLLYSYSRISGDYGFQRQTTEVTNMLPRLQSYFVADASTIWQGLSRQIGIDLPNRNEHQLFFGAILILGAIGGFWIGQYSKDHRHLALVAGASLLGLILFTLYVGPYSPYLIFMSVVPGIDSIRAVARIDLVMALPLAVLSAILIDQLRASSKGQWRVAGLGFAFLIVVEPGSYQPHHTSTQIWKNRERVVDAAFPAQYSQDAVLYLTTAINSHYDSMEIEMDAIWVAQERGLKTINGYSGNVPPGYMQPDSCLEFESRYKIPSHLKRNDAPSDDVISDRVLNVELIPCENRDGVLTGPIDVSLIPNIELAVRDGDVPEIYLVSIRNSGEKDIPTVSPGVMDIKLSWRVVDPGTPASQGQFDTRQEVVQVIKQGEVLELPLTLERGMIDRLQEGGELQVSMVQEAVIWFHDRGMDIATYRATE